MVSSGASLSSAVCLLILLGLSIETSAQVYSTFKYQVKNLQPLTPTQQEIFGPTFDSPVFLYMRPRAAGAEFYDPRSLGITDDATIATNFYLSRTQHALQTVDPSSKWSLGMLLPGNKLVMSHYIKSYGFGFRNGPRRSQILTHHNVEVDLFSCPSDNPEGDFRWNSTNNPLEMDIDCVAVQLVQATSLGG